jgi:hypothetical protein
MPGPRPCVHELSLPPGQTLAGQAVSASRPTRWPCMFTGTSTATSTACDMSLMTASFITTCRPTAARAGLHPQAMDVLAQRQVAPLTATATMTPRRASLKESHFPAHVLAVRALGLPLLGYLVLEDLAAACHATGRWTSCPSSPRCGRPPPPARRSIRSSCFDQVMPGDQHRRTRQDAVVFAGRAAVAVAGESRAV